MTPSRGESAEQRKHATAGELAALQWLIGSGEPVVYSFTLERYYQRRGTPWGRCAAASARMVRALERKGFVYASGVTRAGKRAANP